MKQMCEILGRGHRLKLLENGQEVVDYFVEATSKSGKPLGRRASQCKIALLIVNINLFILNGNEAMAQVIELFN